MDRFAVGLIFIIITLLGISYVQSTVSHYIGCYKDDHSNPAMTIITSNLTATGSIVDCLEFCRSYKYTFSGLKAAMECHCGEDFSRHGTSDSCNRNSTDNSGDICGGEAELSVYSSCPQGFYGTDCNLRCPNTCSRLSKNMCHFITGKCCDGSQSVPYCKFYDVEGCGAVDGDPREGVSNMPQYAGRGFNLLKTLSFPVDAEIYEIEYYTRRGGDTQFLSVWRNLEGDDYMMIDRLKLSPSKAGLQNLSLPTNQRIHVQLGDVIALHYPSSNVQANMIPYAQTDNLPVGISASDLHDVAILGERGETWRNGYTRNMPTFHLVKRTPAISLKYNCIKECPAGKYGLNCENDCHPCKHNDTCNFVDGSCPNGCAAGYQGYKCHEVCILGRYGDNCDSICGNCRDNEPCDHVTGTCDGCEAGYDGDMCNSKCNTGKYGLNCGLTCYGNCLGSCDAINGVCKDGCIDGWTGQTCDIKFANPLTIPVVIGCVTAIIIVTIFTVGVICVKRTKTKKNQTFTVEEKPTFAQNSKTDEYDEVEDARGNRGSDKAYEGIGPRDDGPPAPYEALKHM